MPVLNVDKQAILPGIVLAAAKEDPERTSLTSMINMTAMKDSKPQVVLIKSNNNLMLCLLIKKQNLPTKWESQRIFPLLD